MDSKFEMQFENGVAKIELIGKLDAVKAPELMDELKKLIGQKIEKIYFIADKLEYISSAGLRVMIFSKQKIGIDADIYLIGATEEVLDVIKMSGLDNFLIIQDKI